MSSAIGALHSAISAADIEDSSVLHVLQLIYPRLEEQLMLAKNAQLIEALREVKIHEDSSFKFVPQCQEVLGQL